jgi:uncharacterized protein (TIGR02266 family)
MSETGTQDPSGKRAPASFTLGDDGPWRDAEIRDISAKGAFFATAVVPQLGAKVRVRFDIPRGDEAIELPALVVKLSNSNDKDRQGFQVVFATGAIAVLAPSAPQGKTGKAQREARIVSGEAVRFEVEGAPVFYTGFIHNISHGGLFVHSYNQPLLGQRVSVRFRVPYLERDVELEVRVVWHRLEEASGDPESVGFGAAFTDLPADVEEAINRQLEKESSTTDFFA